MKIFTLLCALIHIIRTSLHEGLFHYSIKAFLQKLNFLFNIFLKYEGE